MGKRLLYLAVLVMAAMVVFAPAAMAQDKLNCVEVSTGDAETIQEEAQALLNENPNGPAQNLDADGDGIACEYTISAQSGTQFEDGSGFISGAQSAPSDAPAQSGVQGPACAELGDSGQQAQQEAQALLNQDPSDPNGLDADGDGIPCEFTESSGQISYEDGSVIFVTPAAPPQDDDTTDNQYDDDVVVTVPTPQPSTPVEGPPSGENNVSVLPDTGGLSGLVPVAGVLLLGGGLVVRRIIR